MSTSKPRSRAWIVLLVFLGALILTQVFWYNFAPLISVLIRKYGISELTASWTILVFPAASLVFSGHAGALIDRRGYCYSIKAGLLLMAVAAALRMFHESFWMLLAAQIGAAVSVPYIVTCISKLVTDWFDPGDEALITGICTIGIFVGMALSLGASALVVEWLGFRGAMCMWAAVAAGWAALFWLAARENHPVRELGSAAAPASPGFLQLLENRNLAVIFATAFIAQGCFNALTTWMELIWHERGFASDAAGIALGMVLLGGIPGSLLIPRLLDRFDYPRLWLWLCLVPALVLINPFLWAGAPRAGYAWGFLLGFLWLPSLAITLTLIERIAHKEHAGAAAGIFWTIGNAGVMALTVLFDLLKDATNWRTSINALILLLALMNALIALLRVPKHAATSRLGGG